jgi:signal transduction histidine kinase
MSADERARSFDRFWSRRLGEGGSGLGLAIVQRLVTSDGGEVELAEAPGGGLDVIVRLPLGASPVGVSQPAPAATRG